MSIAALPTLEFVLRNRKSGIESTTPMFVIESDAKIVAPLVRSALLECKRHPAEANALIARHMA